MVNRDVMMAKITHIQKSLRSREERKEIQIKSNTPIVMKKSFGILKRVLMTEYTVIFTIWIFMETTHTLD